jgi:hypothetical protein
MSRPFTHAAVRPFRVTRAASDAHRRHGPTPFLGCAVCARASLTSVRRPLGRYAG